MTVEIIVTRQLRAHGEQTRSLEQGARSGRFIRIRPGVYAVAAEWQAADTRDRHEALAGPPVVARLQEAGLRVGPPLTDRAARIA